MSHFSEIVKSASRRDPFNLHESLTKKWGNPSAHASGRRFDAVTEKFVGAGEGVGARLRSILTSPAARKLGLYGMGALGVAGGLAAAESIKDALHHRVGKKKAFTNMIKENPTLAHQDPAHVKKVFNTLYTFNKDMANDPLVAGSFARRSLQFKEEGIQPMDVKTLTEIHKNLRDSKGGSSLARGVIGDLGTISGLARFAG